jgi:hypothetical protein
VGHHHPALEHPRQLTEHVRRGGRGVDHLLGDAREALDAAREGAFHTYERLPGVVGLAASHEHGADLGQLAEIAATAVGLRVHGQQLRARKGEVAQIHGRACKRERRMARAKACASAS